MPSDSTDMPLSVRNYEKRLHRHRRLYWRVLLPVGAVLVAGYALGYFMESLLLAALGVSIMLLMMLREIIDVLGYLGSLQRDAAAARESLRREIAELKDRLPVRGTD